ncbi:MAG: 3-phosphoshikimate 1-carboxyvinyltransferase, partial [Candidatus Hadarchaeota archaeon]
FPEIINPLRLLIHNDKMPDLVVKPSRVSGHLRAQPSKSYTHRLLSAALLSSGKSRLNRPLYSFDTRSTVEAVGFFGGNVSNTEDGWMVEGMGGDLRPGNSEIDVGNSGTTIRLMTAISCLSSERVRLTGDESILKRPMGPLVDSLRDLGAFARCEGKKGRPPVVVGEGLEGGSTSITGMVSSQFVSALLMASPFSEVGVDLGIEEGLKSKPYVKMTLKVLDLVGARIRSGGSLMNFSIPGNQDFEPFEVDVPGDFSSAAFPLGAGAITGGPVEVTNLDPEDVQGDKRILRLLREFGADVNVNGRSVKVSSNGGLTGVDVDCSDTPDLIPILSVLGAVAEGRTRLYNASHLRFKEVDRIRALARELRKMNVEVEEFEDGLEIRGSRSLKGGELDSHGDHRLLMALSVAGLIAEGGVKIRNAGCMGVSYPDFVDDMQNINAMIELVKC